MSANSRILNVWLLPTLVAAEDLAGGTVVVIDVLRASTTIVHALANGALRILPCLEVDEAREKARDLKQSVVLGGEREGLKIDGFDLGNSPVEFTPETVRGKTVVFTTTNGTKALQQCGEAARVLIGSFVNLSAVCGELNGSERVDLLCAGTRNQITREDVLFAGAVVDELLRSAGHDWQCNDQAEIAADAWRQAAREFSSGTPLAETLRDSSGGRNLIAIGQERDIEIAARIDRFDLVPELDAKDFSLRAC